MTFTLAGLPLLVLLVGSIVVFSAPVWLAARMVGADHPTLLHAAGSLVVASLVAGVSVSTGPLALVLVPLAFLLSFKFILGTSLGQAFLLAVLAWIGYALLGWLFGGMVAAHFGPGTVPAQSV